MHPTQQTDQQFWTAVREIFDAALDLPPDDRHSYVRRAAGDNPQLLGHVESLLAADPLAEGFLETPVVSSPALRLLDPDIPPFQPGDILCQRFRILRLLGEGGMGHVFEALDLELGLHIALKAIRPEIANHPESLKRFRREVSVALKITHPNVCRTFDLERETRILDPARGTRADFLFLTMELLEGETLASRIGREGALPLAEAHAIAAQVADALACAHQAGILHRDIKPSNILLVPVAQRSRNGFGSGLPSGGGTTPAFRAVVTDFGLAREQALFRDNGLSSVTRSGVPMGTFAYMAPEQLEGAETTPATDVYALGLVLFEMATGRRAFSSSNPLGNVKERLTGPPPSPAALVPHLPQPWLAAIEGCLRLDPAERFQTPGAAIAVLNGAPALDSSAQNGGQASRQDSRMFHSEGSNGWFARRWAQWPRRNKAAAACLAAIAAVSLFAAGLRLYQSRADSAVAPGALVYLTPVKNETGEKSFDNLTELLEASLAQSTQINLLDQSRVGDTLERMTKPPDTAIDQPTARAIALRTGAARVVFGSVTGSHGSYELNIDLQQPDPSTGEQRYRDHWTKSFAWQSAGSTNSATIPQALSKTIRNASDWIRQKAGESKNDIARLDAPPDDVTTGSWQALEEYDQAIQLQRKSKTNDAIQYLKQAVAADSNFALAYARLGDLQVSHGDSSEGLRSYARALNLTELQRLSPRERFRIRGLAAADSGDFETAVEAFREYTVNYPNDYLGWFYLGEPLIMLGREDEGLAKLRRSYEINSSTMATAAQLGMFDAATGHYEEAKAMAVHLQAIGSPEYAAYIAGLAAFLQGDYDLARKSFQEMHRGTKPSGPSAGIAILAHLEAEQGRFLKAEQLLTQGIQEDKESGMRSGESVKLLDRAYLEAELGSLPAMLEDIDSSLQLATNPTSIDAAAWTLGDSLRRAPKQIADRIRIELTQLDRRYTGAEFGNCSRLAKLRLHAEALMAVGDWKDAVAEARKSETLDAPASDRGHLATILLAAAGHSTDTAQKASLLREAYAAFRRTALHPGLAWKSAFGSPPGIVANEMASFLDIASHLKIEDADVVNTRIALKRLRPSNPVATTIAIGP